MGLSLLVHGIHGGGKSTLANTAPGPRLVLDAEGGANWLPGKKIYWTDAQQAPPQVDEDTTVIINILNPNTLLLVYQWLASGKHSFNSVILDSLSEMQKRFIDQIAGTNQMKQEDWGTLLRSLEKVVRDFKDLKTNDKRPLEAVVVVCGSVKKDSEPWSPALQGAIGNSLPFYFDVVGFAQLGYNDEGKLIQSVQILPIGGDVIAKDRTGILSRNGAHLINPNITQLIAETNQA